jgi:hypothetical protein
VARDYFEHGSKPVDSIKDVEQLLVSQEGLYSVWLVNVISVPTPLLLLLQLFLYSVYYRNKLVSSSMTQIITPSFENYGVDANRNLE